MKLSRIALAAVVMAALCFPALSACAAPGKAAGTLSYKSVPGITEREIAAVEALRARGRPLVYAALPSTELFTDESDRLSGYTKHFCAHLSALFGLSFVPEVRDWDAIIQGLEDGSVDFSGDLIPTPERRKKYLMTDAIAERSITIFTKSANEDLNAVSKRRVPKLGFLTGSVHLAPFTAVYKKPFEPVFVDNFEAAAKMLLDDSIDAFINESVTESFFMKYDFVIPKEFFPLTYIPVSLTAQRPEFAAVISVVDKYIRGGGMDTLAELYAQGAHDYRRYQLFSKFTEGEKRYLQEMARAKTTIPVGMEDDNYPICFYNEQEKAFQGIVPSVLREISKLTGLVFEPANKPGVTWTELLAMFSSGKALVISELLYSDARSGKYLWADRSYSTSLYMFLSRAGYPDLEIYQVLSKKVGVHKGTVYEEMYGQWFADSRAIAFDSVAEAFAALEKGEIDLFFTSGNHLLSQANYRRNPGFKANIVLHHPIESKFGFRPDQNILASIVSKAQAVSRTEVIASQWERRTYDYAAEIARTRLVFLLVFAAFLLGFLGLLGIFLMKNVSLRKNLEQIVAMRTRELERQTATLTAVYAAIPDLVFCKDVNSLYTSCNPSFEKFVGKKEAEIIGKSDKELFTIDAEMAEQFVVADKRVLDSRNIEVVEELVTYPNGTKKMLETLKAPLFQQGAVTGMLGISRDVTERKAAEEAAQAASRAKGAFLARMSHEIRTPLNAVIGMSEIAKKSMDDPEKALASINQALASSRHLLGIINDVLDVSKIESGKLEMADQPFSLAVAAREAAAIISSRCAEKQVVFATNSGDIPDVVVMGDKLRLNQVLINLLGNAVKFTDNGGEVSFHIQIVQEDQERVTAKFTISDTGIGMTREQLARLFVPFEQADNTIAARFGGTGLGLSISKNLIQAMGGYIAVASEPGAGSRFYFTLTFAKGEAAAPEAVVEAPDRMDLCGRRILLAEDIEVNRIIVHELLDFTGVTIDEAENGRQAVDIFLASEPGQYQLIFMDVQMPVLDGYGAAREIRASSHPDAKGIPIIAMTANAYTEDVNQALASGMNGHLAKPVDLGELVKAVARAIPPDAREKRQAASSGSEAMAMAGDE